MDPGTLAGVGIAGSIASGFMGADAAEDAANAQAAQLRAQGQANQKSNEANAKVSEYRAQVARNNAVIAQQNADYEEKVGRVAASDKLAETGAVIGKTRAIQGASGVDVNSGSAADVQASERFLGDLDAQQIISNAVRKAYGYKVQGTGFENEATLGDMSAANSREAGTTGVSMANTAATAAEDAGDTKAFASLISGASSVSDKWLSYKNKSIV